MRTYDPMLDAIASLDESGVKTKLDPPVEAGEDFDVAERCGWRMEVRLRIRFGFR